MQETYESLAAIAVFRELYDQGKDIYDVLAMYVKEMILREKITTFTCTEITRKINEVNSFNISEAVIKSALKRLKIKRKNGIYVAPYDFSVDTDDDPFTNQMIQSQALLDDLFSYLEQDRGGSLKNEEKNRVKQDFFDYLMNGETSNEYSLLISKYIMKASLDSHYIDIINRIKEGTLIYEGICYSGNIGQLGKWNTELNIYLEQEILFYIAGYNGEVHKEIYTEMLKYVYEINNRPPSRTKYISLWYTQEVKDEIDSYFSAAEMILEKGEVVDPSRKPMMYILEKAKTKSAVVQEKVKFYALLEHYHIHLFEFEYYSELNRNYSIVNAEVYNKHNQLNKGEEGTYVQKCTDKLNYIEILRKNNNSGFDSIKHILLTANGVILKCAYSEDMYKRGDVPKATDVDFLINKFWFKLNKGFGKGKTPKSLNIVSRAQMVLALIANEKVSKVYDEVKAKYDSGEIREEEAARLVVELRTYSKTPDEIKNEVICDEIRELVDFDINKHLEEMKREQLEREQDKERIKFLENEISILHKQKNISEQENKEAIQHLQEVINREQEDKNKLSKRVEQLIVIQENQEKKREMLKQKIKYGLKVGLLIFLFVALFCVLVYIFKVEKGISSVVSIVVTILFGIPMIKEFVKKK